jgi:beta-galactosidase
LNTFRPLLTGIFALQSVFVAVAGGVTFDRAFAPQEGLVCRYEEPARDELCLNGRWRFHATDDLTLPGDTAPALAAWSGVAIKIPSPWNVNSFAMNLKEVGGDFRSYPSYPREWEAVKAAWMEKTVTVPKSWAGKRIALHFGAVAGRMAVYVNGQRVGEGFDLFFAQEFDVTGVVKLGAENRILVKVISPKVFDDPGTYGRREYLSGSFWGTHIAGLWQDVFLLARPEVFLSDVFVQPLVDRDELVLEATLVNRSALALSADVSGKVHEWINETGTSPGELPEVKWSLAQEPSLSLPAQSLTLQPGEVRQVTLSCRVSRRLKIWSPESPNLCGALIRVTAGGKVVDVKYQRFGWRQFTISGRQLLLNGKPMALRGDSWHFMGVPQMTRRYAYGWYQLLKDAGANAVRPHAMVYPSFYHDMADEMGILVLDESAIWLSDGGPKGDSELFWKNCRDHVMKLVLRDRNHPSVFGWSVCNEILPVMRNVWHMPQAMVDRGVEQMSVWRGIVEANDPTRPWISGDGEWDAEGRLPTINLHYGGEGEMKRGQASGKPWGVGETSMAYYGTPKQVSRFNGDRAYESALGRMEGLAYECYDLLRKQQRYDAAYQSVFNIVWYAVMPLPLGKRDLTKPFTLDEGVFFGQFREGVPGVQPERLGPYSSTLNPGYDPALPLYEPWPMFDAIRDANTGEPNSPWAQRPSVSPAATPAEQTASDTLFYLPPNGRELVKEWSKVGVKTAPWSIESTANHLLVNGAQAATLDGSARTAITATLARGGTVWFWEVTADNAESVSRLLGAEVIARPRTASSFVVKASSPLLAGLDTAAGYFSEDDDWKQVTHGLGGEFVAGADLLLEACPNEWRSWNYQPEAVKTASLYRSGVERTAPLAVMVSRAQGNGRVILCNLDPAVSSIRKAHVLECLLGNAGIQVNAMNAASEFVDLDGRLMKALVCGSFAVNNPREAYGNQWNIGEVKPASELDGRLWRSRSATPEGVFDFKQLHLDERMENASAYVAIWIKSPKPLNDLLSEPNLPRLSFHYGCDDGCQIWLNRQRLVNQERIGPHTAGQFQVDPLLLQLGWNQLVIKVVQAAGEWRFSGRFDCTDRSFLSTLEFAMERPEGE